MTSISVITGTVVEGRELARNGSVTLDNNTLTARTCSAGPTATASPTATGPVVETDRPGDTGSSAGLVAGVAALVAGIGVLVLGYRRPGAQR